MFLNQQSNEHSSEDGSEESDSEKNKDFFEQMVYWKFEENRKAGTKKL